MVVLARPPRILTLGLVCPKATDRLLFVFLLVLLIVHRGFGRVSLHGRRAQPSIAVVTLALVVVVAKQTAASAVAVVRHPTHARVVRQPIVPRLVAIPRGAIFVTLAPSLPWAIFLCNLVAVRMTHGHLSHASAKKCGTVVKKIYLYKVFNPHHARSGESMLQKLGLYRQRSW